MLKKYSYCYININFPCYSSSSSSSSLVLLWESLSFFSGREYSSGYRKQYTSSLTNGLRFVIILLPAALLKGFDCNSREIYGTSRLNSNSAASSTLTHYTFFMYALIYSVETFLVLS